MKEKSEPEVSGFLSGSDDDFDDEENFKLKELDLSNTLFFVWLLRGLDMSASKQASRQASRQASKQVSKKASKQASKQAGKQAGK